MNRFTVTFFMLAAASGCLAVDRDPLFDYDVPRKSTTPPWVAGFPSNGKGADGKFIYMPTSGNGSRSSLTASDPTTAPAGATIAAKNSNTPSPQTKPKSDYDEALTQATYTKAPSLSSRQGASAAAPTTEGAKSTTGDTRTAETKGPPINLGVLRLLNSKRIAFHYEIKGSDTSGVAGLELWGTKDMREWKKYDAVPKSPHSFVAEVKEEGLYGFTIVARGKDDLSKNQPPRAGEVPQVWVAIDVAKPVVQLLGAEPNVRSSGPALVIRWTAHDKNFGPRPITLLYAEHREGPWSPLAANLENNGRYEWNIPACVPPSVYVRVQAIDLMGNVGMAQTTTLHVPSRSAVTALRVESATVEPPRLLGVPPPPTVETAIRPAASIPNPAVSIVSVDGD